MPGAGVVLLLLLAVCLLCVIGFLLSGACTVLIGYVSCHKGFAVGLVVLSTAFIGISSAAVLGVNQLDLSTSYAGQTARRALLCSVFTVQYEADVTMARN